MKRSTALVWFLVDFGILTNTACQPTVPNQERNAPISSYSLSTIFLILKMKFKFFACFRSLDTLRSMSFHRSKSEKWDQNEKNARSRLNFARKRRSIFVYRSFLSCPILKFLIDNIKHKINNLFFFHYNCYLSERFTQQVQMQTLKSHMGRYKYLQYLS